jgi:hypothetical protein
MDKNGTCASTIAVDSSVLADTWPDADGQVLGEFTILFSVVTFSDI